MDLALYFLLENSANQKVLAKRVEIPYLGTNLNR